MGCGGDSGTVTPPSGNTLNPTTGSPGMKSGALTVDSGNLRVTGSGVNYGSVLSVSGTNGTATFTVHVDTLGAGDNMAIGVASASHDTTNGGNSWVGGDAFASGVYNNLGTAYQVGTSAGNLSNLIFVAGDTVTVTADAVAHTVTISVNGGSSSVLTAPSGTLYAFIECDNANAQATINLSSFP